MSQNSITTFAFLFFYSISLLIDNVHSGKDIFVRRLPARQQWNIQRLEGIIAMVRHTQISNPRLYDPRGRTVNDLTTAMNACLNSTSIVIDIDTKLYNTFLNELIHANIPLGHQQIEMIDYYYDQMVAHGITPDDITFNTLLKAVRLTHPLCIRCTKKYLNEMGSYKVRPDTITVVEIIGICAKAPYQRSIDGIHTNVDVGRYWFDRYLNGTIQQAPFRYSLPSLVFNTFLNLVVQAGQWEEMTKVAEIAYANDVNWTPQMITTWQKGERRAGKRIWWAARYVDLEIT
eukprot:1098374_1